MVTYDDAVTALNVFLDYCNESLDFISKELKSVNNGDERKSLLDAMLAFNQLKQSTSYTVIPSLQKIRHFRSGQRALPIDSPTRQQQTE